MDIAEIYDIISNGAPLKCYSLAFGAEHELGISPKIPYTNFVRMLKSKSADLYAPRYVGVVHVFDRVQVEALLVLANL